MNSFGLNPSSLNKRQESNYEIFQKQSPELTFLHNKDSKSLIQTVAKSLNKKVKKKEPPK